MVVGGALRLVFVEGVWAVNHRLGEGLLEIADFLMVCGYLGVYGNIAAWAPEHLTLSFVGVSSLVQISSIPFRAYRLLDRVRHAIYPVGLVFDPAGGDHGVVLLMLVDWTDVRTRHGLLFLLDL